MSPKVKGAVSATKNHVAAAGLVANWAWGGVKDAGPHGTRGKLLESRRQLGSDPVTTSPDTRVIFAS